MWQVIGWIIWGILVCLAISFARGCRTCAKSGLGIRWAIGIPTLFFWIIAILFLIFGWNKLHMLWITPLAYLIATLLAYINWSREYAKQYQNHYSALDILFKKGMSFEPRWYKMLAFSLKPIEKRIIKKLEDFREKYEFTDEEIIIAIETSQWAVERIQKFCFEELRKQNPNAPEKELWKAVLLGRFRSKLMVSSIETDPFAKPLSKEELLSRINNIDNIMCKFRNFEDVINYIVEMDEEENRFFDPTSYQIMHELNDVLEKG